MSTRAFTGFGTITAVSYTHLDVYKRQLDALLELARFALSEHPHCVPDHGQLEERALLRLGDELSRGERLEEKR